MEKHLIDKAYDCAKENFKKSPFTFKELFELLLKKEPSIKNEVSDLYIEILQDIRFISLGKQKWALRENFKYSEISKITASMFGLEEYHEEDADQYMSDAEKSELKSKANDDDIDDYIDEDADEESKVDLTSGSETESSSLDDEEVSKDSEIGTVDAGDEDEDDEDLDIDLDDEDLKEKEDEEDN